MRSERPGAAEFMRAAGDACAGAADRETARGPGGGRAAGAAKGTRVGRCRRAAPAAHAENRSLESVRRSHGERGTGKAHPAATRSEGVDRRGAERAWTA